MPDKTIPMSVRVTHEDAEFIAQYNIQGATTPSDKLRAIISDARRRHYGTNDYVSCLNMLADFFSPAWQRIQAEQTNQKMHSELVAQFMEWLPETMAYFITHSYFTGQPEGQERLTELETELGDRIFRFMENVFRLGITKENPCYDKSAVIDRVGPMLELGDLLKMQQEKRKETS